MSIANTLEFSDWLSMECLDLLVNDLPISGAFNSSYGKEYDKEFAVGETVRIPYPAAFIATDGLGYTPQAIERIHTNVTVNQVFGVHFEWNSIEEALKLTRGREKIQKEILAPAMAEMKQQIESRAALYAYQNSPNIAGVLGTNPTTLTPSASLRQQMLQLGGSKGEKRLLIPPSVNTSLAGAFMALAQPLGSFTQQFKEGYITKAQGFDWGESVSLYSHTAGVWASATGVTVTGAASSGTTLNVACTTGDTFLVGDIISINNVNPVNPRTRRRQGTSAKTFVVTANATGAASLATLQISPAIVGPGSPYQNVDALPVAGAVLTLFPGTVAPSGLVGTNGLALGEDAFALVGVKMANPEQGGSVQIASQMRDPNSGIAIAVVRMFDPIERKWINRFDSLMGFGTLYADAYSGRYLSA